MILHIGYCEQWYNIFGSSGVSAVFPFRFLKYKPRSAISGPTIFEFLGFEEAMYYFFHLLYFTYHWLYRSSLELSLLYSNTFSSLYGGFLDREDWNLNEF